MDTLFRPAIRSNLRKPLQSRLLTQTQYQGRPRSPVLPISNTNQRNRENLRPRLDESGARSVVKEPHMGIESLLWLSVNLQDEFDVCEMKLQASIDDFAGIGKILSLAWVGRPLALAKVFASP